MNQPDSDFVSFSKFVRSLTNSSNMIVFLEKSALLISDSRFLIWNDIQNERWFYNFFFNSLKLFNSSYSLAFLWFSSIKYNFNTMKEDIKDLDH